jgi:hypothetical protein
MFQAFRRWFLKALKEGRATRPLEAPLPAPKGAVAGGATAGTAGLWAVARNKMQALVMFKTAIGEKDSKYRAAPGKKLTLEEQQANRLMEPRRSHMPQSMAYRILLPPSRHANEPALVLCLSEGRRAALGVRRRRRRAGRSTGLTTPGRSGLGRSATRRG